MPYFSEHRQWSGLPGLRLSALVWLEAAWSLDSPGARGQPSERRAVSRTLALVHYSLVAKEPLGKGGDEGDLDQQADDGLSGGQYGHRII
jgi:hypothetical protein